jgi:hypothetical protein
MTNQKGVAMKKLILLSVFVIFVVSAEAYGDVTCTTTGKTVSNGMDKGDVVMSCGAPMWHDKNTYITGAVDSQKTDIVEVFVYSFPDKKVTINFLNGRVRSTEQQSVSGN